MMLAAAGPGEARTFVVRDVAPEQGVSILNRTAAQRLVGRTLLQEPAGSAVLGEVHLYDEFPFVQARWVHVTSDAGWRRLLYGVPGEAPRAYGAAGELVEPRGVAFGPDGRLFVADRGRGSLVVLRLRWQDGDPVLDAVDRVDGLQQPMDVAVHDGGTPADPSDDRLLVAEAGAQRLALFDIAGARPVRLAEFGRSGSAAGEFLYPRAVCVGRQAGAAVPEVYVADAGNHRIVRLGLHGTRFEWRGAAELPLEATSLDSDHHGNLYVALRRAGSIRKLSPDLVTLAEYRGGPTPLAAPRDVAVPFAWVHDHRGGGAAPAWRGEGSALVLEAWGADTGVRRLDLGVELAEVRRSGSSELELLLTDAARLGARIVSTAGVESRLDLGSHGAGRLQIDVPGLESAARVVLEAESEYGAGRGAEASLDLAALPAGRLRLHPNVPNPFNPTTVLVFELPQTGPVVLDIFDARGRRVRSLMRAALEAGTHRVAWDGRDARGVRLGSGLYFARLQAGEDTSVRKMVLAQ
jgi:hypothetical protein